MTKAESREIVKDKIFGRGALKATRRGYVLGFTDDHGFGVYATRTYRAGDTVMVAPRRHAADPVDMMSRVNHSSDPNCGIEVNALGTQDLVARHLIVPGSELTC